MIYIFSTFLDFSISTHPYLSIGTPKTNIAPIIIWGYLFEVCSDHPLRLTLLCQINSNTF